MGPSPVDPLEETGLGPEALEHARAAAAASADPEGAPRRMAEMLRPYGDEAPGTQRLSELALVAGASRALSATLVRHPHLLDGTNPEDSVPLRLRSALLEILVGDLGETIPLEAAMRNWSDAVDSVVEDVLAEERLHLTQRDPETAGLGFAVIAMGKWGARELNYHSDIDLVFVHDAGELADARARPLSQALAGRLLARLGSPTFDGPGLVVDAALRPEGSMGPLSRSLDGYEGYYRRWGEAWELQALLKARAAAGDRELGGRFEEMAGRIVWDEGIDVEALRSIRRLKARAEEQAAANDLKRSRGGIRDIEFSVQLLQMVHGRADADLRVRPTLDAVRTLSEHGYIETEEGDRLESAYRFLRHLEHRLQVWDMRQTHSLPDDRESRERLGRAMGFREDPARSLDDRLSEVRRQARDLHERLYFRPILDAIVGGSGPIDPEEAELRLEALGFADTKAASKALSELTAGLSRRSRVMRQVLPLLLDWLSLSPDPDLGLSQLRLLMARSTDHSNLVGLLHANPLAGRRLCLLLGTGRLLGDLLDRIPEFVPRLADEQLLAEVRGSEAATHRLLGLLESRPDEQDRIGTIRRFIRRRKLRIAGRDVLLEAEVGDTLRSLSDSADAAMAGSLNHLGAEPGFLVMAMGKWGGRELSYGSDLDLMYVFDEPLARERALGLASGLSRVLSEPSRHGEGYRLDADLRPEGRKGPLARSLDGYRRYYEEWVEPWELLALIKARPAGGDQEVARRFFEMLGPVLWEAGRDEEVIRSIRAIKARIESERIPPGEDPDFHLKLGPGGLSDVEFLVQLIQLRRGGDEPDLRVTGTLEALARLEGRLPEPDIASLRESYAFCTRARLRLHLQSGRASDSLPTEPAEMARLASSLGFDRSSEMRERYRTVTRRARRVFLRHFYE